MVVVISQKCILFNIQWIQQKKSNF